MTEGRLKTESRNQECLTIIKREVTSNDLSKRRVRPRTHSVVGGRGLAALLLPNSIFLIAGTGYITNISVCIKCQSNVDIFC